MWQDSESKLVEEKYDGQASKMHIYHVYIFTNKVNFVSENCSQKLSKELYNQNSKNSFVSAIIRTFPFPFT